MNFDGYNAMKKLAFCLAAIGGFASTQVSTAWAADWSTAEATSRVSFVGVQQGTRFTGRFEEFTATIDFDPGAPDDGSIVGRVQLASVNTRDHDRDATLLDGDWFDAANYPESVFESESITELDDGSFEARGQLSLKGRTRPVAMTFTFAAEGDTAKFSGAFKVDRFDFNVGEGWNDTSWVGQDVDVQIELDLNR